MKTKKNLKNSMKSVAAFSFAAAMVLSLSAFNTVDKKKLTVVADPLTELASTDQSKADNDLARLRQSPYESTFKATLAEYNHEIESREKACEAWHTWRSGDRSAKAEADVAWARENYGTNTRHIRKEITAWQTLRSMYVSRAQAILNMPTLDGSGTLLASSGDEGAMASFTVPAKKSVQEINEVMLAGLKLQEIGKEKAGLEQKMAKEMTQLKMAKANRNKDYGVVAGMYSQPAANLSEILNIEGKIKGLTQKINELEKLEKDIYEKYGNDLQGLRLI